MRTGIFAAVLFVGGAFSGGASVHTVYTSRAVSFVEPQGEVQYSDADRRHLRRLVKGELLKAKMYPGR